MPKRAQVPWEWQGVDIDYSVQKTKEGDVLMSCRWCGAKMKGGPARIRAHHAQDDSTRKYALCDSKAVMAVAFRSQCQTYIDEQRERKKQRQARIFQTQQNDLEKKFVKERDAKKARGIDLKLGDIDRTELKTVNCDEISAQLCRAFVSCGIPAFALRKIEFKRALNMIKNHAKNCGWELPTPKALMGKHLDALDREVRTAAALCNLK